MKLLLTVALFYFSLFSAQEDGRRPLSGLVAGPKCQNVSIVNRATENRVESSVDGHFRITSKPGDTLVFASSVHQLKEIVVAEKDFDGNLLVTLEPAIALAEVIVEKSTITAASLGIPVPKKSYTPAERRLATAGDLKPMDFLGLLGGGMQADPIINAISGRTAQLKKEVEIEKKEYFIALLESWFDEYFFTHQLSISAENIRGFLYYAVENKQFMKFIEQKNRATVSFLIGELALRYNDNMSCEQE